ncbi:histone-fold-containing protein [Linnemannia elongata]|nr:histone-fold-containing protein [Linnemannia elongata]
MYDTYHHQAAAAAAQASNSSRSNINNEAADTADSVPAAAATGAANTTLHRQQLQFAQEFWEEQIVAAEQYDSDFKNHPLPLARIKKVMKSDPEVKMISAEAPILFSKACEIFICEITRRAWLHAEENKRRTLQRSDVANAVSRSDQFDFLIDIVPRRGL